MLNGIFNAAQKGYLVALKGYRGVNKLWSQAAKSFAAAGCAENDRPNFNQCLKDAEEFHTRAMYILQHSAGEAIFLADNVEDGYPFSSYSDMMDYMAETDDEGEDYLDPEAAEPTTYKQQFPRTHLLFSVALGFKTAFSQLPPATQRAINRSLKSQLGLLTKQILYRAEELENLEEAKGPRLD